MEVEPQIDAAAMDVEVTIDYSEDDTIIPDEPTQSQPADDAEMKDEEKEDVGDVIILDDTGAAIDEVEFTVEESAMVEDEMTDAVNGAVAQGEEIMAEAEEEETIQAGAADEEEAVHIKPVGAATPTTTDPLPPVNDVRTDVARSSEEVIVSASDSTSANATDNATGNDITEEHTAETVFERSSNAEVIQILERNGVAFNTNVAERSAEDDVAALNDQIKADGTEAEWTTVTSAHGLDKTSASSEYRLDTSLLDTIHASTSSIIPSVQLTYNSEIFDLFVTSDTTSTELKTILFEGNDHSRLCFGETSSFMRAIREVFTEIDSVDNELVLSFPDLGISIAEVSIFSFSGLLLRIMILISFHIYPGQHLCSSNLALRL
jgi:hypothetical protein